MTSCLILSFFAFTMAHLISSKFSSSYMLKVSFDKKCSRGEFNLEFLDRVDIDNDSNVCIFWCPSFFQNTGNLGSDMNKAVLMNRRSRTSPRSVFSNRPFTIRAEASLSLVTNLQLMIGVLIAFAAFMISFIRGTPRVTFIEATPAKWKVFSVICVPGSPMD